ncbi:CMP-sialic acid transporter 5 [Camellia lanceoleosa]|uniref:CMP-sialic acid transporter 5 n=1 Tax=Camellia lanceoleosa TaxID=1840588 RepID=A0ACC0HWF7_9ERIC|nr:CMP-sialic acid transporter 5 [Camellia lanceoleosa]
MVTIPSLASVYNEYALKSQYDRSIYLQALAAASRTVDCLKVVHSLHCYFLLVGDFDRTMVPGIKTGRRKRATNGNVLSAFEACPQEIGTPMTFSDETQPPDDTQIVVEKT